MNSYSEQKRIAFGYERDLANQIKSHPVQSLAVELIFRAYADGQSTAEIAEMLKSARIPSPRNNLVWGKQTLANILSNPHYIGDKDYPRIIEQELFDTVQLMKANRAPSLRK